MNSYWKEIAELMQSEARKTPCEKCKAKVGEPCVSAGGFPTQLPHLYRHRRGWHAAREIMTERARTKDKA
jgi:hypothetical protein